ncbi:MAG: hypothetical protein AN483_07060 [Aphanizomenon flos-aquae MDT14a]|jgi:hypothetical protein|nr:MAG: hypothetical protein AN483_07060 [Aphanizomenon flos-aquae MDT14a]
MSLYQLQEKYAEIEDKLNAQLTESFLLSSETEYDLLVRSVSVEPRLLDGRGYLEIFANCKKWNPNKTSGLGREKVFLTPYMVFQKDVWKVCPILGRDLVRENVTGVEISESGWIN